MRQKKRQGGERSRGPKPQGRWRKATITITKQIRSDCRKGLGCADISEKYSVNLSTVHNITRDIRGGKPRKRQTPAKVAKIMREYMAGVTVTTLSKKYGVSKLSVYRYTEGLKRPLVHRQRVRKRKLSTSLAVKALRRKAARLVAASI